MIKRMLATTVMVAWATVAQAGDVRDILQKFQTIRPQDKDLALYGLDWAPTLRDAKARAAKEHRPIFLIVVTNSFGNIYTGHC